MKYRHFLRIDEATLPKDAFEQICHIAPHARKPYGFDLQVDSEQPDGGELVRSIVEICNAHGLRRCRVINATSYGHSADRWYDDDAYAAAELLVLGRQNKVQGLTRPERDDNGRLLLHVRNAKQVAKLGRIFPNWIVVSQEVRQLLERAHFLGMCFGDVCLLGDLTEGSQEPFWELQSSLVLPKMANTHQFIHTGLNETEAFAGDYAKTIMIDDPPFSRGEIHYRRSDLAQIGSFDVARTFENYMEPHAALVISQRFYQYCLRNKISLHVDPVRIDEE